MRKNLLIFAALPEGGFGLLLLSYPPIVARLLFAGDLPSAGVIIRRLTGGGSPNGLDVAGRMKSNLNRAIADKVNCGEAGFDRLLALQFNKLVHSNSDKPDLTLRRQDPNDEHTVNHTTQAWVGVLCNLLAEFAPVLKRAVRHQRKTAAVIQVSLGPVGYDSPTRKGDVP